MSSLTTDQLEHLSARIAERKRVLLGDVRRVLERTGAERHADLVGEAGDAGDEAAAIGFKRLDAYPTAKRCIACQRRREKTRAPSKYTGR